MNLKHRQDKTLHEKNIYLINKCRKKERNIRKRNRRDEEEDEEDWWPICSAAAIM